MKKLIVSALAIIVAAGSLFAAGAPSFKSKTDSLSYVFGYQIGKNMQKDSIYVNYDLVKDGIEAAFTGKNIAIDEKKMQEILQDFQNTRQERMQQLKKEMEAKKAVEGKENLAKGKKFLDSNAKAPGIKTTASGLQYRIIKEGTGASPKAEDKVNVDYEGKLISGEIFDSSFKRGEPIEFPLNGVIKGWTEGLQLMKEGGEFIFYIPSDLAYGERGAGAAIGPDETLIFRVVLHKVETARAEDAPKVAAPKPAHK